MNDSEISGQIIICFGKVGPRLRDLPIANPKALRRGTPLESRRRDLLHSSFNVPSTRIALGSRHLPEPSFKPLVIRTPPEYRILYRKF